MLHCIGILHQKKFIEGGGRVKHHTHFMAKKEKKSSKCKKEQRNNKMQLVNPKSITFFIGP